MRIIRISIIVGLAICVASCGPKAKFLPITSLNSCIAKSDGVLEVYIDKRAITLSSSGAQVDSTDPKQWSRSSYLITRNSAFDMMHLKRLEDFISNHEFPGYRAIPPLLQSNTGAATIGVVPCSEVGCGNKVLYEAANKLMIYPDNGSDQKVIDFEKSYVSDATWSPSGRYLAVISTLHKDVKRSLTDFLVGWVHYPGYEDIFLTIFDQEGAPVCKTQLGKNLRPINTGIIWKIAN